LPIPLKDKRLINSPLEHVFYEPKIKVWKNFQKDGYFLNALVSIDRRILQQLIKEYTAVTTFYTIFIFGL